MKSKKILAREFDINKLIIEDIIQETKGYRVRFKYTYPDGSIDYPVIATDRIPITYGIDKYQQKDKDGKITESREGESIKGMDLCLGPRGIRRDPDNPRKFILPRDMANPDAYVPGALAAETLFLISDSVEAKLVQHMKEKNKRNLTLPYPGVRAQNQPIDDKKPRLESQTLHAHLSHNPETGEITTSFQDRNGPITDFESVRSRSKEAEAVGLICLASAFIKTDLTAMVQWRMNHMIICKWGVDPRVKAVRSYDLTGVDFGEDGIFFNTDTVAKEEVTDPTVTTTEVDEEEEERVKRTRVE